jgi:hypothetical protein
VVRCGTRGFCETVGVPVADKIGDLGNHAGLSSVVGLRAAQELGNAR